MSGISFGRRQHDLSIARQFDLARAARIVGNRNLPHLGILFGRNNDLRMGYDAGIRAPEIRLVFRETYFVRLWRAPNWLVSGRPNGATVNISQINEGAPVVSCDVFAPAG